MMRRAVLALIAAVGAATAVVVVGGFLITRSSSSEAERERIRAAGSDGARREAELAAIDRPFDRLQRSNRLSEYVVLPLAALAGGLVVAAIMKGGRSWLPASAPCPGRRW